MEGFWPAKRQPELATRNDKRSGKMPEEGKIFVNEKNEGQENG
jgi:hypothetical protein